MSWLGFGKKKKEKPEVVYKIKLDQLAKLGYTDRKKNLEQLKLYAGNVNLVIKDYTVQHKQKPTQQPKQVPKPEPAPKQEQPQVQAVQPVIPDQAAPPPLQPEQKQEKQVEPPTNNKQTPEKEKKEKEKEKAKEYQGAKISEPKLKAVQPIMPDMGTPKTQTQSPTMLFNLRGIVSSDIRQILLNIGEPQIGEIIFSNSIDGDQFYHFIVVNPLLKQFNLSFGDETSYTSLVHQVELSYQKNGAVDIHNTQTTDNKQDKIEETKEPPSSSSSNEPLKNNMINLISSDARLLLLPYHVELAERFYAFSLNGNDLSKFDYDGICFATGIKTLSKQNWNTIVTELSLPQSDPFDITKWNKLQQQQEAVIKKADNMQQEMQNLTQKRNKTCTSMHIEKEEKAPPKKTQNLKKQQIKQLNKIILMEKEADKFLPQNLQKLKQRQLTTLTSLHDIASIVDLDENVVNDIQKSARRQSEIDLQNYLKSGTIVIQKQFDEINSISPQALEKRQLELLLKINKTRKKLEILANKKGVSLESLNNVKSKVNVDENDVDIVALNKQYGNLFGSLANIAVSVQSTATKYGVELESGEINQHLGPMYDDLERKQNELIARIQYLNDQARMINPKAVEVNEDILHSSV